MGLGISLVMSSFNRTHLFRFSYPTWFETKNLDGTVEQKTWPDEIIIVNDNGATDLEEAVRDMTKQYPDVPVTYKYRDKGFQFWSNPAIPHNWLVKQAKYPIVVIIDPEAAFISDGLPFVYSYFHDEDYDGVYKGPLEDRRRSSLSAGTCYSIQTEFMHIAGGISVQRIPKSEYVSTDPTTHQIIARHGPAHCYRAWWRERYLAIGGKDERYLGWGYEDLDLAHRNQRFQPPGGDACDHRIEIVEYGHGLQQLDSGQFSVQANRLLWEKGSPEDGIANKGQEWGIIQ